MYSRCLSLIARDAHNAEEDDGDSPPLFKSVDQFPVHWRIGIDSLEGPVSSSKFLACYDTVFVLLI